MLNSNYKDSQFLKTYNYDSYFLNNKSWVDIINY